MGTRCGTFLMRLASPSDLDMLAALQDEHSRSVMQQHYCNQACNTANSAQCSLNSVASFFCMLALWAGTVGVAACVMACLQCTVRCLSVQCHTKCWCKHALNVFLAVLLHTFHSTNFTTLCLVHSEQSVISIFIRHVHFPCTGSALLYQRSCSGLAFTLFALIVLPQVQPCSNLDLVCSQRS